MAVYDIALNFAAGSATATCVIAAGTDPVGGAGGGGIFPDALLELVADAFAVKVMPGLCADLKLTTAVLSDGGPVTRVYNTLGGSSSAMASLNTSYLVRKHVTGARNGRMFLPGVSETAVGPDGIVVASLITSLNTKLNDWLAAVKVGGETLYVVDHTGAAREITSFSTDTMIGTQRRRVRR